MNKEQQELLNEAYKNYLNKAKNYTTEDLFYNKLSGVGDVIEGMLSAHTRDFIPYSQEEFIDECKTDDEFAKKWGLKIEERELSLDERTKYKMKRDNIARTFAAYTHQILDNSNIPTKLITVTYKEQKIESYE
jgi:hypothetical protein